MSTAPTPKRPRGRPRKDGLPPKSSPTKPQFPAVATLLVTLRYNPKHACLCEHKVQIAPWFCPHHGLYDNKSKGPPEKEAAYGLLLNKRKRDDEDDNDQEEMFPETPKKKKGQIPPSLHVNRISPTLLATKYYDVHLCILKNKTRNLTIEHAPGRYRVILPRTERETPLTQIDFLDAPLEFRKVIYRHFLVGSSKRITFPSKARDSTFSQLNPKVQTGILYANRQVHKECIPVLYGENLFVAKAASEFFLPTGIKGLRRTSAQKIKHIAIHNYGPTISAFLNLETITLRLEVSRPVNISMSRLQMYFQKHGVDASRALALYKKTPIIMDAAARVAFQALRKRSPFHGLFIAEQSEHTVWGSKEEESRTVNVNELSLLRFKGRTVAYKDEQEVLHKAILHMLTDEREKEIEGAEERWDWFKKIVPFDMNRT